MELELAFINSTNILQDEDICSNLKDYRQFLKTLIV